MARYNGTAREVKVNRQLAVSRLRVKGLSIREIQEALAEGGETNPLTDAPWSVGIIQKDCRELEKAWRAAAMAEIAEYKARQLAEIGEAKRVAWAAGDVNQVRQLIKLEMELLGTEAPKRQEVSGMDGAPLQVEHRGQVHGSVEHVAAVVATLAGVGALELPGLAGGDAAEDDGVYPPPADG